MRLGSTEIAGAMLDLSNGAGGAALAVVISTQLGSISGAVDADASTTAGLKVVLRPDGPEGAGNMIFSMDGNLTVGDVSAAGNYSFDSLIPGTYKLAVISKGDFEAIREDEDEWGAYASVTETVNIRAGEKINQDLKALNRQ